MLTAQLGNRVRLFESLFHIIVEPPTPQHEEQEQTQLQDEGQHAQHDDGGVNC